MIRYACEATKIEEIRAAIAKNDGYCPCQLERSDDTRCMCKSFREQKEGLCHCGLYVKTQSCH